MSKDLALVFVDSAAATLNPTLLAAVLVMLLLPHPNRLMLGYLAGAYTISVAVGLAVAFSLHGSRIASNPGRIVTPGEEIAAGAGALAIVLALATRRHRPLWKWRERHKAARAGRRQAGQPWQQRMLGRGSAAVAFAVGVVMSFPGVSYLSALRHIIELDLPAVPAVLLVVYFCLMQQILLELVLLASLFAPAKTHDLVARFKTWLTRHGRPIAITGLAGAGVFLLALGLVTIG